MFVKLNEKQVNTKSTKIIELLNENNINIEECLVKKNGVIVTENDKIKENDKIETIPVRTGG